MKIKKFTARLVSGVVAALMLCSTAFAVEEIDTHDHDCSLHEGGVVLEAVGALEDGGESGIVALSTCSGHNIVSVFVATAGSAYSTHKYYSQTHKNTRDCTITQTIHIYRDYCTKCGATYGNYPIAVAEYHSTNHS